MKVTSARRNRAARFGAENLTPAEKLQRIVDENPSIEYVATRLYPDGFTSATGARRGKWAVVVRAAGGSELLLTKSEAEKLRDLGAAIPFSAFKSMTVVRDTGQKTVRDLF